MMRAWLVGMKRKSYRFAGACARREEKTETLILSRSETETAEGNAGDEANRAVCLAAIVASCHAMTSSF
jgi:hypothetical protein